MASSRIVIDSRLRDFGTVEEYQYTFSSPVRNVQGVTLLAAVLPKSSYQVITGFNDTVDFNYNSAGPHQAVLISGNYTGATLATEVARAMDADAGVSVFTGAYSTATGRITITSSAAAFTMGAQSTTPQVIQLLGFTNNGTGATSYTGANMVNTSWPLYLLLDVDFSSAQGSGDATRAKNNTYTMVVPYGASSTGQFEYYTKDNVAPQGSRLVDANIQTVHVRFRPPDTSEGNPAPPANWSMNNVDHVLVFGISQSY